MEKNSLQEGINRPIEDQVVKKMKWFMTLGDNTDSLNKGERDEYDSATARGNDITKSDHVMMYGYSEWLSQVMADKMCQQRKIHASCIIAPPLGKENHLLTFTDALIVNKSKFSNEEKATAILKFLKFTLVLSFEMNTQREQT